MMKANGTTSVKSIKKSPSTLPELRETEKPSSPDLVLARMLDLAAQITRQEVQPGEIRFWSETFQNERPQLLEWAFREYLKTAQFFPKPGDIDKLLKDIKLELAQGDSFKSCGKCTPEGWVLVGGGVKRCECHIKWAAARKA